ncbi:MAG: tetratricopeptide repeat protein [Candidatus Binatia bacterium]
MVARHLKKRLISPLAGLVFLASCAGLGVFSEAQYEFDAGLALFNRGSYEEATPHFQRAIEIDPDYAEAYLYLGRSFLNLTKWLEAIPPLRTAIRLSPDETKREALNLLIDALLGAAVHELESGDFISSIDHFTQVLQRRPKSSRAKGGIVKAFLGHGKESLFHGNVSGAIDAYTKALKFSPTNVNATLGLAKAFLRNGELGKAIKTARDAMRVDPTNREAESLFRSLLKQR